MLRGHDAYNNLRGFERSRQIAGRGNRFGQDEPGQEALVDVRGCDALDDFGLVGPEPDLMNPFASEHHGQSRAPRSGSDDGNAAHLPGAPDSSDPASAFAPNLASVPSARRPMFRRCLQMTSAATAAIKINCRESAYSWKAQANSGKAAAMATDPSET